MNGFFSLLFLRLSVCVGVFGQQLKTNTCTHAHGHCGKHQVIVYPVSLVAIHCLAIPGV